MRHSPQALGNGQWPMAAWLWLSMMSILKCRDLRGLNATGSLVSLTFPTATAQPSSYSPLHHLLSFALHPHQLLPPETNSEADTRRGKEPQVIAFLCWDSSSNPLRAGRVLCRHPDQAPSRHRLHLSPFRHRLPWAAAE